MVSQKVVEMSQESVEIIQNWPQPQNAKKVLRFLGQVDSWIAGKAGTEISVSQNQNPHIAPLYWWLERGTEATQAELALTSMVAKKLWLNNEIIVIRGGLDYRRDESLEKLLVPKIHQQEVISQCHDIPLAGHQGVTRTKEKVKEKFIWCGRSKSIVNFVCACSICNLKKNICVADEKSNGITSWGSIGFPGSFDNVNGG
ncbi:Pol polyprotein [Plakobranchus ocellatus]|uniref:Pol polyprotein n=1 Tax=Plakobranchus ocellatus TaxID=259542 RepID=A0AAV4A4P3_9GAST|nr:Pol polyprotein [Plakobranchus ocellatus]